MNRYRAPQSIGIPTFSRAAQKRDHLPTQDSTISGIFGRRQKIGNGAAFGLGAAVGKPTAAARCANHFRRPKS